jgi:MutS domain V
MKAFLLYPGRDFAPVPELDDEIFEAMLSGHPLAVTNARRNLERRRAKEGAVALPPTLNDQLTNDLELETLWSAMSAKDEFLYETARRVLLTSLSDRGEIVYRQNVLADCFEHQEVVRSIYDLAIDALECGREILGSLWDGASPDRIVSHSSQLLALQFVRLKKLRQFADEHAANFQSEGFRRFFTMLQEELSDDYLEAVARHLSELRFDHGLVESAQLGQGNKGKNYVVRLAPRPIGWRERLFGSQRSPSFSFTIHPRDEAGFRMLEDIRGKGLNQVANAVAQSADHVKSFFAVLRVELAFYLACLNLRERLAANREPVCFPVPVTPDEMAFEAEGLYDVCLSLHLEDRVVSNDIDAGGRSLVMITGANQGGKSTFLRSVGLAQLMMEAGMVVGAESLRLSVAHGVFTHYKREEDAAMEGGKLDEELARMSEIVDALTEHSLLLCNESFASTNEREGSEIARQIIRALLADRVRVVFVTHMFDLADSLYRADPPEALFLRAEREESGRRTFHVVEGEPLPTSYGADSYRRIFGAEAQTPAGSGATASGAPGEGT